MTKIINEELAKCAQINFENFQRAVPGAMNHPYYKIAKLQLDEALGGKTVEEVLGPPKILGSVEFDEDGNPINATGIMKDAVIRRE